MRRIPSRLASCSALIARGGPRRRARHDAAGLGAGAPALEAGAARRHGRLDTRADRPAAVAEGAGRDPHRQDQGAARLQGGAVGARDQQCPRHDLGRQGHAVRQQPRGGQCLRGGGQGRPARGEGDRQGPQPAQRRGLQGRHALRRGGLADHEDARHRGQARQSAGHGSGLRHPAARSAAWLEVPGLRAGRQALLQYRRAVQYLHPAGHPRQYLARERRRQRLRVLRPRRAQ